jgi:hypothetical protein
MSRRHFILTWCCWALAAAGCSDYEESDTDKATKSKIVGYWYWTWTSLKYGEFHILTHRQSDGVYIRRTTVFPEGADVETSEESGKWGVNFGRYVEKQLTEDGKAIGNGQRDQRYIIKSLSDQTFEIVGERVRGPEQIERRVTDKFNLPQHR